MRESNGLIFMLGLEPLDCLRQSIAEIPRNRVLLGAAGRELGSTVVVQTQPQRVLDAVCIVQLANRLGDVPEGPVHVLDECLCVETGSLHSGFQARELILEKGDVLKRRSECCTERLNFIGRIYLQNEGALRVWDEQGEGDVPMRLVLVVDRFEGIQTAVRTQQRIVCNGMMH